MSTLVLCSAKGSPGVTTTALALAGSWPSWREAFLVEVDPSGGDLQVRLAALDGDDATVLPTPSTVQLAAATAQVNELDLVEHSQCLPGAGEVRALLSPLSGWSASTALEQLVSAGLGRELLRNERFDMIADVGRLDARSPAMQLVRSVGSVLVVTRATIEAIEHTRELVRGLNQFGVQARVLLIGDARYAAELTEVVGAEVAAVLPDDPDAAAMLCGTSLVRRRLDRTRLIKAARVASLQLAPAAPAAASEPEQQGRRRKRHTQNDEVLVAPTGLFESDGALSQAGGNGHGNGR